MILCVLALRILLYFWLDCNLILILFDTMSSNVTIKSSQTTTEKRNMVNKPLRSENYWTDRSMNFFFCFCLFSNAFHFNKNTCTSSCMYSESMFILTYHKWSLIAIKMLNRILRAINMGSSCQPHSISCDTQSQIRTFLFFFFWNWRPQTMMKPKESFERT